MVGGLCLLLASCDRARHLISLTLFLGCKSEGCNSTNKGSRSERPSGVLCLYRAGIERLVVPHLGDCLGAEACWLRGGQGSICWAVSWEDGRAHPEELGPGILLHVHPYGSRPLGLGAPWEAHREAGERAGRGCQAHLGGGVAASIPGSALEGGQSGSQ